MIKIEVVLHEATFEAMKDRAIDTLAIWLEPIEDGSYTIVGKAPVNFEAIDELRSFYDPESTMYRSLLNQEEWNVYRDRLMKDGAIKTSENAAE